MSTPHPSVSRPNERTRLRALLHSLLDWALHAPLHAPLSAPLSAPLHALLRTRFLRQAPAFLLGLMLVCAQQSALQHALEHDIVRSGASAASGPTVGGAGTAVAGKGDHGGGAPAGAYCDKCFQFAHLSGTSLVAAPAILELTATTEAARGRSAAERPVHAPPTRSRGPPSAL